MEEKKEEKEESPGGKTPNRERSGLRWMERARQGEDTRDKASSQRRGGRLVRELDGEDDELHVRVRAGNPFSL